MATISYGEDWSEHYASIVKPISIEEAEQRYNARQAFSAILFDDGNISRVVSFLRDWVGVRYYDSQGRCNLEYHFDEVQPNQLFLIKGWVGKYNDSDGELREVEIYHFHPKGTCSIEITTLPDRLSRVSPPQPEDISRNWEPYPQLHDLTSIIRRER